MSTASKTKMIVQVSTTCMLSAAVTTEPTDQKRTANGSRRTEVGPAPLCKHATGLIQWRALDTRRWSVFVWTIDDPAPHANTVSNRTVGTLGHLHAIPVDPQ
jgi:hypothetical protein